MIKFDLDPQPQKNLLEGLMLTNEFSSTNRPSAVSQRSSRLETLNEFDRFSLLLREY